MNKEAQIKQLIDEIDKLCSNHDIPMLVKVPNVGGAYHNSARRYSIMLDCINMLIESNEPSLEKFYDIMSSEEVGEDFSFGRSEPIIVVLRGKAEELQALCKSTKDEEDYQMISTFIEKSDGEKQIIHKAKWFHPRQNPKFVVAEKILDGQVGPKELGLALVALDFVNHIVDEKEKAACN